MAKQKKLIDEHNYKIVLQQLAENEFLDVDLSEFEFENFSHDKTMFSYQQEALQNAFRVLVKYFSDFCEDKERFYGDKYRKYPHANLDYVKPSELIKDNFPLTGGRVEFYHFINRMSFWMTMGSGKTIVIIKLIELLDYAMRLKIIPKKNILFFTARQDLIDKFKVEIENYNELKDKTIELINLKDYEDKKRHGSVFDSQLIKLFYYRSDLMNDERKESILNYQDYLDNGDNYVILDEAHKGDKQDSKKQNIFSILSKNGFLFNFSATFTDESDIVTTVYNLNQAVWVKKGYGKKLFLLDNDLKAFREKTDLNEVEKQRATIKSLLLLALAKKYKLSNAYHNPMMVVFTNSVNTVEADAELFFKTLQSVAKENLQDIFEEAKKEIIKEFKETKYLITDKNGEGVSELAEQVKSIKFNEAKEIIFYAKSGNIEAIVNPKDKTEIAFKLDSSDKPFCLIKIGDISSWIKEKLASVKIDETFKEEDYFSSLDDSTINILLGSRSFYEGWDITRPNIMLFLNIGMDKEAKKFITQSIGRGMRVESVKGSRQRIDFIDVKDKADIQKNAKALETLFVMSTNKEALDSIIAWQEEQSKGIDWHEVAFKKNDVVENMDLYIPTYSKEKVNADKLSTKNAFKLSEKNKNDLRIYAKNLGKELFSLKHKMFDKKSCDLFYKMIDGKDTFFIDKNIHYKSLDFLIEKLKKRLHVEQSKINEFKTLKDEIIHFKKIKVREDKKDEVEEVIKQANEMKYLTNAEVFSKAEAEGLDMFEASKKYQKKEIVFENAKFRKMLNHYYIPVVSGEGLDWIKNIISEESEIVFLKKLSKICNKIDEKYDWWMFSKLSEHYDKEIFIPYTEDGKEKPFYPDFIFWLQKDDKQTILFIDPKGNAYTSFEHKVDGYRKLFLDKEFTKNKTKIEVKLALVKQTDRSVGELYEKYWISKDELESLF